MSNKEDRQHKGEEYQYPSDNIYMNMCDGHKGDIKMNVGLMGNLFEKEVIGLRDLRSNISEIIGRAINSFEEIISGNAKKGGAVATASIISTALLDDILTAYKFNPVISFDEATNQHEIRLDEINVYGSGETKEAALQELIELVIDSTQDYFTDKELYMRIPEMKEKFPYFLRIKHCSSIEDLLGVLNLDN